MDNAFGQPQSILLLGGTSEIGLAIVRRLIAPTTRHVVLACRVPSSASVQAEALRRDGLEVHTLAYDAADAGSHEALVQSVVDLVGDIDVAILAAGVLGEQPALASAPAEAAAAVTVNYTGGVSTSLAVANRLRLQGHGALVVLSSVAGERARKANYIYGSSKAGLDAFAQGLADDLHGSGAKVLVVRPGFVESKMTRGLKPAPFATTPDAVADAVAAGLQRSATTIWVPGTLRYVFSILRHVPRAIYRRLPLDA
jgi:decaprenylphospho-beta-D-erythro-pentofuranosid-2-ulose 2-reductase